MILHTQVVQYNAYIAQKLIQWFSGQNNQELTILDFGCGTGMITSFMHNHFYNAKFFGIDTDGRHIQANRVTYPEITFIHSTAQRLPFPNTVFDVIYSVNVLHHINQANLKTTLYELLRIMKQDGSIIIFELNPHNVWARTACKQKHTQKTHMLSGTQLQTVLRKAPVTTNITYLYPSLARTSCACLEPYIGFLPFGSLYVLTVRMAHT